MAPSPTKRLTRSSTSKTSTESGKKTARVAKKTKKPGPSERPYRHEFDPQDHTESLESPTKRPRRPALKSQASSTPEKEDHGYPSPVGPGRSTPADSDHGATKKQTESPAKKAVRVDMDDLLSKTQSTRLRPRFKASSPAKKTDRKPEAARLDTLLSKIPQIKTTTKSEVPAPKRKSRPVMRADKLLLDPKVSAAGQGHRASIVKKASKPARNLLAYISNHLEKHPDIRSDRRRIENLLSATQPQTVADYEACYHDLQSAAWGWALKHFHHIPNSSPCPNLMKLATELMEYINSTTSSPQLADWEALLDKKRAEIVYAILGKVLDVHVFGEEMFGATPSQREKLRASDRASVEHDGFIRQHSRAHQIHKFLSTNNDALPPNFIPAIHTLQGRLITLLTPLLPTPQGININAFSTPLLTLLLTAATLSLSTRRNPDIIIYFPPAPAPGTAFDEEEMTMQNQPAMKIATAVEGVRPLMRRGMIRRAATITGWPGCVAYRPVIPAPAEDARTDNNVADKDPATTTGIHTDTLARPSVHVTLEVVDPMKILRAKERQTLRGEMYSRVRGTERQERRRARKVQRRMDVAGVAAMVAVIGGYAVDKAGGWESIRGLGVGWEVVKGFGESVKGYLRGSW